jgi:hypothetical protein
MTAAEMRDALQENRLDQAARIKLASDINRSVMDVAALQGSLVVARGVAATGFADVAAIEAVMNEQGIPDYDRFLAFSTRDYNGIAADLAARQYMPGKPTTAYERAYVGRIASFETFKLDYAIRLTAQTAAALVLNTLAAGGNVYVPQATHVAATGERSNVDNRFQQVTIAGIQAAGVVAGDAFTVATVDAVHHITKGDTGQLKTFRIISVDGANTATICPPLISGQGGTDAELQYQNCVVNTPVANSAIVFLNATARAANPFWHKDAIEILPGRYAVPDSAGASVMRATTDQGIELVMQKQYDINTMRTKYRLDTLYGVVNKQPEMSGIITF